MQGQLYRPVELAKGRRSFLVLQPSKGSMSSFPISLFLFPKKWKLPPSMQLCWTCWSCAIYHSTQQTHLGSEGSVEPSDPGFVSSCKPVYFFVACCSLTLFFILFFILHFFAGASTLRTTALDNKHAQICVDIKKLMGLVKFPLLSTLTADGWTNINGVSVWVFIALLPGIGALTLKSQDASADSHNAEWISGMLLCTCSRV